MPTLGELARFRSQSQRRRLQALVDEGKFPQSEFDSLHANSPTDLPERATAKRRPDPSRKYTAALAAKRY